ncbi:hypothetical protein GCM10028820_20840 [Tessaracoccus terricola]
MTEKDISEILKSSAPGAPRMADLGDRVRKGHRRRRTIQVATAGVAVLALGVPAAIQLSSVLAGPDRAEPPVINPMDPSETPTETPGPEPTQTPTGQEDPNPATTVADPQHLLPDACEQNLGLVTQTDEALIPEGATKVWLCSGDQEPNPPQYGAPEPLVANIDDIIRGLNAQPLTDFQEPCGPGDFFNWSYMMVLEYPDREPFVLGSETDPCIGVVNNGTQQRGDGRQFFLDVREQFFIQRQELDYSYAGQDILCPDATSMMSKSMYDGWTRGVACGVAPEAESMDEDVIAKGVPNEVVTRIIEEATANAEVAEAHGFPPVTQTLQLANRFGDPYTMYRMLDGSFLMPEGAGWMTWMPSEELASELATYWEGTRTEPFDDDPFVSICLDPDTTYVDFPVAEYAQFGACVTDADAQYSFLQAGTDQGAVWAEEIEAAGRVITVEEEPDFTGSYLMVEDADGSFAVVYVATDGTLVWDTPERSEADERMAATPSESLLEWIREVGIDVQ